MIFNSNGQLVGLAFAPSSNGQSRIPQATLVANGMQFTVTGLNSGTHYMYQISVKNGENVVASYSGEFTTTGEAQVPTSIDNSDVSIVPCKVFENGQIFILRGDKTYTITGQKVK